MDMTIHLFAVHWILVLSSNRRSQMKLVVFGMLWRAIIIMRDFFHIDLLWSDVRLEISADEMVKTFSSNRLLQVVQKKHKDIILLDFNLFSLRSFLCDRCTGRETESFLEDILRFTSLVMTRKISHCNQVTMKRVSVTESMGILQRTRQRERER